MPGQKIPARVRANPKKWRNFMTDCLFCKIVKGEIQPAVVYENDHVLAFRDIRPQAPTHILAIPKAHIATLDDLEDPALAGELMLAVRHIAKQEGLDQDGYRAVVNCRANGGQEVYHLHVHLLGGRRMSWPPG
jgi:histidine triad (HIT) family protein